MNWKRIFRDAVPSVAGVVVYEKELSDSLGRYVVAKTMDIGRRTYRNTQSNFKQRPAALRAARKFLNKRAEKAGKNYTPGDGVKTIAFQPEGVTP